MTFKPGDKLRRKLRNIYVTVASMFEDGTAFVDDSGITPIAENWEPLPAAKPEDVRAELMELLTRVISREYNACDVADAILAKYPKMLEGT